MEDKDPTPAENLLESHADEVVVADEEEGGDEDGGGFTFPVLPLAGEACGVTVYPIFGRPPSPPLMAAEEERAVRVPLGRLLLEERDFCARQREGSWEVSTQKPTDEEGGELEGVPPESYYLWAPGGQSSAQASASPRRCRKSGSTGSVLRWRRISERLVGRSHSNGKEKFVFLNTAGSGPPPPKLQEDHGEERGRKGDGGSGVGGCGWSYYGKGGGGSGGRRRSYLPYKQELVGLFTNVSGLRRSYPSCLFLCAYWIVLSIALEINCVFNRL